MLRRLTFILLVLFAVFVLFVANDAAGRAELASAFLDWLGHGLDKTRNLVDTTLADDPGASAG